MSQSRDITSENIEGKMDYSGHSLFSVVESYLSKLRLCTPFLGDLGAEESESIEFISSSFSLLRELSKLEVEGVSRVEIIESEWKKVLRKYVKKESVLQSIFEGNYIGDQEWIEEVNYVYIWVLNNYKLDLKSTGLDEIKRRYSSEAIEPEILSSELPREEKVKVKKGLEWPKKGKKEWSGFSVYKNLFRTDIFSLKSGELEDNSFESIVAKTQALERLEREIRSGRIYIYLSKPVRNLKLKKCLSGLFMCGAFLSSFTFLAELISAISGSSFSSFLGGDLALFSLMSLVFFLLSWLENNRDRENENFRYCFSRKIFYYYFFLSSFFIFSGDFYTFFSSCSTDTFKCVHSYFLFSSVLISVSFFLVCFFCLNPKKNKDLIRNLLQKYSNPPYLNNSS